MGIKAKLEASEQEVNRLNKEIAKMDDLLHKFGELIGILNLQDVSLEFLKDRRIDISKVVEAIDKFAQSCPGCAKCKCGDENCIYK